MPATLFNKSALLMDYTTSLQHGAPARKRRNISWQACANLGASTSKNPLKISLRRSSSVLLWAVRFSALVRIYCDPVISGN